MKAPLLFSLLFIVQIAFGQGNPFVRDIYTADPSAHVWEDGRLYVYPSQDNSPPRGCDLMDKYHVFSTDDMVNWVDHGQIVEAKDVPWGEPLADNGKFMWAPDCAYKDGKYYFYFPHPNKDPWNENWKIGIAVSDKPASDFVVLDHWLIGLPDDGHIDPCIFMDDDGQAYFYYGGGNRCYGAKLKDNMIELDGELQQMTGLYDFHEGAWIFKRNDTYYLTYADNYSGANRLRHATSSSPLGPWSHKGIYLQSTTSDTSHGSVVEYQGQWWAFYHTADLSGTGLLRSICVDPLYFKEDGTIQTVVQSRDQGSPYQGVVRTTNDVIEAEDYNSGGQGIAYWSKHTNGINTGAMRKNEHIIISQDRRSQTLYVNSTSSKEYINYTIEVLEDGIYDIDFVIGSANQNPLSTFYIEFDWHKSLNPWKHTAPYAAIASLPTVTIMDISLTKGTHTLNYYPLGNLNFDKFSFRKQGTSIKDTNKEKIKVYPNPSDGIFHISTPSTGTISVYNSQGGLILTEQIKDSNHTIDISKHAAGIYFLTIQSGDQTYQTSLIKK